MANAEHMFVVTGGPGSGKSSLIDAMTRRGFRTMPEAGRAIIQDQVRIGGPALPWADRAIFAELMLGWELRSYHEALASDAPVLMDRGIPDVVGYLTLCGLPVPAHVEAAAKFIPTTSGFSSPRIGMPFSRRTPSASRTGRRPRRPAGSWPKPTPGLAIRL